MIKWISIIIPLIFFTVSVKAEEVTLIKDAIDESAGDVPCFKIKTPIATYFLEKEGAGLSSMIDKDGNDWLSFNNRSGSGAGGEYRGFPNAVHQQNGSFFHPMNSGTDPSEVVVDYEGENHVILIATSNNETWQGRWDFTPTQCTFTMTRMPERYKYWILYEGTPGGKYDDTDWWMTSAVSEKQPLTKPYEGDIPAPEWIVFGDPQMERVIFLLHHEDDDSTDRFYQMNKLMTVFGFGRQGLTKYLQTVPQSFSIGFLETTDHGAISQAMNGLLKRLSHAYNGYK